MNEQPKAREERNTGATHSDLLGGTQAKRFRPERVTVGTLSTSLTCTFLLEGQPIGPLAVLDVSPTGLGIEPEKDLFFAPGTQLEKLQVRYQGLTLWEGDGLCVYQVEGPPRRVGVRFTTDVFDVQRLLLTDSLVERGLERELVAHRAKIEALPVAWRAAVSDLGHLLGRTKLVLDEIEKSLATESPSLENPDELTLIELAHGRWVGEYHGLLGHLQELSTHLDPDAIEFARAYATQQLLDLILPCPLQSRAHDKPLGYAGDFRLMIMYFTERLSGDTLYGRFLHYSAQHYPLGRTVVARESTLRQAIRETIAEKRPMRVMSLACGPAIEVQRLLNELDGLGHPVELLLVDQDEDALKYSHDALSRALALRHRGQLPITLNCLHLSVRQILRPRDEHEHRLTEQELSGIDLIYSAGLFDYLPKPVAQALIARLYDMLAPGGRLFLGNLCLDPVTTWIMEYVLAWHLVYRDHETMMELAEGLTPKASGVDIVLDETERCMFLDIRRPT